MPNYHYAAIDGSGRWISGRIAAVSKSEADTLLQAQGFVVTRIRRAFWDFSPEAKSLSSQELFAICRELAVLLRGGVSLPSSLTVIAAHMEGATGALLNRVRTGIETGARPGDAFTSEASFFEPTFLQMVQLGQESGDFAGALERYCAYNRRQHLLRTKIRHASYYPIILLGVILVAISILLLFALPRFSKMYEEMGTALPPLTEFLLALSRHYYLFLAVVAVTIAFAAYKGLPRSLLAFYRRLPLASEMVRGWERAQLMRSFSTLLASGMSAVAALGATAALFEGATAQRLRAASGAISAGGAFSHAMAESGLLTPAGVRLMEVAERTGELTTQALALAEFYEEDVDHAITRALALVEPVTILVMGLVVGAIVLAMYLPIFSMASALQ